MGGALKSIGNAVVGGLKDIGSSVIKSVAPKAIDLLKNVVGSGFDALTNVAKGFVSKLPLVGPLASGLIDKLAPGLKNLATGSVESLLTKLTNSITERLAPGTGQNVSLPDLVSRLPEILKQTQSAATSGTSSSSSAASSSGTSAKNPFGGANTYPDPSSYAKDPKTGQLTQDGLLNYNRDVQMFQDARNMIQEMAKRASDLAKSQHDAIMMLMQNIK